VELAALVASAAMVALVWPAHLGSTQAMTVPMVPMVGLAVLAVLVVLAVLAVAAGKHPVRELRVQMDQTARSVILAIVVLVVLVVLAAPEQLAIKPRLMAVLVVLVDSAATVAIR
jgi:hypothetical protein